MLQACAPVPFNIVRYEGPEHMSSYFIICALTGPCGEGAIPIFSCRGNTLHSWLLRNKKYAPGTVVEYVRMHHVVLRLTSANVIAGP